MPGSENASPRSAASRQRQRRASLAARRSRTDTRRDSARPRRGRPSPSTTSSTCSPPNPGTTPAGIVERLHRRRAASVASPYAATVSGEARTSTGMTSSNASVSSPTFTVIWIARPADRFGQQRRTALRPSRLPGSAASARLSPSSSRSVRIEALDRHDGVAGGRQLAGHDGAEVRLVADGQEARERRLERDRLVDADLAVARSEPRAPCRRRPP